MIDLIRIVRTGDAMRVFVGDVEIPAGALPRLREDALVVPVDADDASTVRLELIAKRVEVENTFKEPKERED